MQDRLKINKKSLNQFQNGLMQIRRIRVKTGQMTNLSQTKKVQTIVKKNTNVLQSILIQVKKKKEIITNQY